MNYVREIVAVMRAGPTRAASYLRRISSLRRPTNLDDVVAGPGKIDRRSRTSSAVSSDISSPLIVRHQPQCGARTSMSCARQQSKQAS